MQLYKLIDHMNGFELKFKLKRQEEQEMIFNIIEAMCHTYCRGIRTEDYLEELKPDVNYWVSVNIDDAITVRTCVFKTKAQLLNSDLAK